MIGRTGRYPLPFPLQYIWSYVNNGTHDFITAYQLSPLISLKKLRDTLNSYMEINSTFNVILEEENGRSVQVYNNNPPKVEIETMTEDEVKELQKTFIQSFKHGEPLYRIRLIKTRLHKYMFFDMNHIVSDGSGMFLMLQDIMTLYKGGYVRPAYYFAHAYDASRPLSEEFLKAADDYYINKFDHKHRKRNYLRDDTQNDGPGIAREISFPEDKIEKLVSKYNSTNTGFIHLVIALAQEHYNGRPSFGMNAVENRSPNENTAGMHVRTGCFGITTKSKVLLDLFEDMNVQQYNNIRFANYDMSTHIVRDDETSSLTISYIGHWFDPSKQTFTLGKQLKLENHVPVGSNRPPFHIQIRHENGRMIFRFNYDRMFLSDEHAEHIMSLMEFAGNELLEGRYPQFSKEDED
jgi:hypothetical protein